MTENLKVSGEDVSPGEAIHMMVNAVATAWLGSVVSVVPASVTLAVCTPRQLSQREVAEAPKLSTACQSGLRIGTAKHPKQSMRHRASCLSEPTATCCSARWWFGSQIGFKDAPNSIRVHPAIATHCTCRPSEPPSCWPQKQNKSEVNGTRPATAQQPPPAPATRPPPDQWSALLPLDDSRSHQQPFQARF
jgi:hypothetical protein